MDFRNLSVHTAQPEIDRETNKTARVYSCISRKVLHIDLSRQVFAKTSCGNMRSFCLPSGFWSNYLNICSPGRTGGCSSPVPFPNASGQPKTYEICFTKERENDMWAKKIWFIAWIWVRRVSRLLFYRNSRLLIGLQFESRVTENQPKLFHANITTDFHRKRWWFVPHIP